MTYVYLLYRYVIMYIMVDILFLLYLYLHTIKFQNTIVYTNNMINIKQ